MNNDRQQKPETPEEKAKRLRVPLIPKRAAPAGPNPIFAVCGECGIGLHRIMGYSCSRANCPSGLGPMGTM